MACAARADSAQRVAAPVVWFGPVCVDRMDCFAVTTMRECCRKCENIRARRYTSKTAAANRDFYLPFRRRRIPGEPAGGGQHADTRIGVTEGDIQYSRRAPWRGAAVARGSGVTSAVSLSVVPTSSLPCVPRGRRAASSSSEVLASVSSSAGKRGHGIV